MDHKTDIRFVDAHPKCVRRHDRFQFIVHECVLIPLAITRFHTPVILPDFEVETFQSVRQFLDRFNSRGVNDGGAFVCVQYANERFVLLTFVCHSLHFELQIRTINTCFHHLKFSEIELLLDVGCDFRSRGSG